MENNQRTYTIQEDGTLILDASVTGVDKYTFAERDDLRELIVQGDLRSIGDHAFFGCSALEHIVFVQRPTELNIGSHAFANCTSLKEVHIATTGLLEIGHYAFANCTALTGASVAGDSIELHEGVFAESGLVTFVLPDNACSIHEDTFRNCHSLRYLSLPYDIDGLLNELSWQIASSEIGIRDFIGKGTDLQAVVVRDRPIERDRVRTSVFSLTPNEVNELIREHKARNSKGLQNLLQDYGALSHIDFFGVDFADFRTHDVTSAASMFEGCTTLERWAVSQSWPVDVEGAIPTPNNERRAWWSKRERTWLSVVEIRNRGRMADMYTLDAQSQR